jgi:KDO2-lipid IV(A) lauroyltransferase
MAIRPVVKRIRRDVSYALIRFVIMFFRMLSRGMALSVGSAVGAVIPYLARKEVNRAVAHLRIAFGGEKDEQEIRRLVREMFRHLALNFVDTVRITTMDPDTIREVCIPHDIERVWEALRKGHGIIGLGSHTGCWELLGVYLSVIGVPVSAIAQRIYDPRLEKMLTEIRAGGGMHTISRGHDTRDIIRVLKEGGLLGVLIDQDIRVKGTFVDFFGRPAYTATAPAQLSLKYKSPILPIFTYRDSEHRHHVCIGEPVAIEPTGDFEQDVRNLTAECSKVTERFIRDHPEQWVWFHERWKTRLDDE